MKKHVIVVLALTACFGVGQSSHADPVATTLTLTGASEANLFISALSGSVTAEIPFEIEGTIDVSFSNAIDDSLSGLVTTSVSLDGAEISLSDESINLNLGFLGNVSGAITGADINTLDSNGYIDLTVTNPVDPFEYTFDPGAGSPTELSIDQGLFTYNGTGPIGGLLGSGTLDFSSDPVSATLDQVGQIGLVTQNVVTQIASVTTVEVVVSAPLEFTDTILTDPIVVNLDLSGALYATGFYTIVPEPSTVVLLGLALVVLIPLRRQILNRWN